MLSIFFPFLYAKYNLILLNRLPLKSIVITDYLCFNFSKEKQKAKRWNFIFLKRFIFDILIFLDVKLLVFLNIVVYNCFFETPCS